MKQEIEVHIKYDDDDTEAARVRALHDISTSSTNGAPRFIGIS